MNRPDRRARPAPDAPPAVPAGRRPASSASRPPAGSRRWRPTRPADPKRRKSCILLWMTGGPSQTDTFDPKPGHANGGQFKAIETAVPGIRISEHLPKLAKQMKDIAIIRSMSTKEGRPRPGDVQPPDRLPAARADPLPDARLARRQGAGSDESAELPELRQHRPGPGVQPGGVQPRVPRAAVRPADRRRAGATEPGGADARNALVQGRGPEPARPTSTPPGPTPGSACCESLAQATSSASHPGVSPSSHQDAYQRAVRLMRSAAAEGVRAGRGARRRSATPTAGTAFGQGCLLARRLVERGVPFVEVTLSSAEGGDGVRLGHPRSRTSTPSRSSARCSTRPGRP